MLLWMLLAIVEACGLSRWVRDSWTIVAGLTTCNLTAALERRYTSAFSDPGPEASVVSSHYQAPSPSSRISSQTAPVQQAVEAADPENSALLGKVQCIGMPQPIVLHDYMVWS